MKVLLSVLVFVLISTLAVAQGDQSRTSRQRRFGQEPVHSRTYQGIQQQPRYADQSLPNGDSQTAQRNVLEKHTKAIKNLYERIDALETRLKSLEKK